MRRTFQVCAMLSAMRRVQKDPSILSGVRRSLAGLLVVARLRRPEIWSARDTLAPWVFLPSL